MPDLKTYDIFISHAWKYGDDYNRLVNFLEGASYFNYRNYSAPKEKPLNLEKMNKTEIKIALDNKIRPVNVVLVISGMYFNHREWMQYELDSALALKKPIIAIKPYGNETYPLLIQNVAIELVNWNKDSIVNAIRKHSI